MKFPIVLLLLVLFSHGKLVHDQQTPDWIKIAPPDERFQGLMPQEPSTETVEHNYATRYGQRTATGKLYSTSFEGSTYAIWSLETLRAPSTRVDAKATFLDEYADLVWESLLKSRRDAVAPPDGSQMLYKSELSMGVIPGREYWLKIGKESGVTRVYMDGGRLYVLAALRSDANSAHIKDFFSGFLAKPLTKTPFLPIPADLDADPPGQVFKSDETTTKAKVLSKPEPQYTEPARKYGVTGTIVLRGVVSTAGRIESIQIVKRLPHGLTEASVAAAKGARFTPATKDGYPVQQFIQLEYNFVLY